MVSGPLKRMTDLVSRRQLIGPAASRVVKRLVQLYELDLRKRREVLKRCILWVFAGEERREAMVIWVMERKDGKRNTWGRKRAG